MLLALPLVQQDEDDPQDKLNKELARQMQELNQGFLGVLEKISMMDKEIKQLKEGGS